MDDPKTPGQLLRKLLAERDWTQQVLATVLELHQPAVNQLLADKRAITAELAVKLEHIFAGSATAEDFLKLQSAFDLSRARFATQVDPRVTQKADLLASLPVPEMIKRGWIAAASVRDFDAVEAGVLKLFGVTSLNEIRAPAHAAKKTGPLEPTSPAQLAWLHRARGLAAHQLPARPYAPAQLMTAIAKLDRLLSAVPEVRHVPRILSEAGVRFVIVEGLSKSKIDGACMWLDAGSPVIAMSLRHDRIDNFWFVLRHEIEHILWEHGQNLAGSGVAFPGMIDTEAELFGKEVPKEEQQANEAASNFCVPKAEIDDFILRKAPIFRERDMLGFAARLKIHPGLVAGQLRYRLERWDLFSKHLVKVRQEVTPGSTVDGWGDVAPEGE